MSISPSSNSRVNRRFTIRSLRWALNIASALTFFHTRDNVFEGLSPNTVHLRSDLSVALVNLDVAAYKEQAGSDGIADGYRSPDWFEEPLADQPQTWIIPSQDIYAFGSLLYYFLVEEDPEPWEGEEDMPELEENDLVEDIRNCWLKEFGSMNKVVEAVKKIVAQKGLELSGRIMLRLKLPLSTLRLEDICKDY